MEEDTIEETMVAFLKLLAKDKEESVTPFLFKFIERIIFDTMDLGSKGFQPILNFTLLARQSEAGKTEFIFRPIRTDNHEIYEMFKLAEFGVTVAKAWEKYGKVWGITPLDKKDDFRILGDVLDHWKSLKKKPH